MPTDLKSPLFGIYLHWPYCTKICPYCDFNVYTATHRDETPLVTAMRTDLARQAEQTPEKIVTSIYFGGGTPSLISPEGIGTIRSDILSNWASSGHVEVTLEANPEDVTPDRLRAWHDAGVNRISLGVQALDDGALRFLGRAHTTSDAERAVESALSVFDNVSVDLIYARPGQSIDNWLTELNSALALGAPHLSLYELTIKEKTAFQKQVERSVFIPLDEEAQADLYSETLRETAASGLPAYEVSNHARNERYWSRHNLTYWLCQDWLGIGPGAEGRYSINGRRRLTRGLTRPGDYMTSLQSDGNGLEQAEILSSDAEADEYVIMGLRSVLGIDRTRAEALYGASLDEAALKRLSASGHLILDGQRIRLTEAGWLLADHIVSQIIPVN